MTEAQKIDISTAPRHCGKPLLGAVPYSEVYLMDCVAGLRHYPDNYFDLAVVDPPYGINISSAGGYYHIKGKGQANPHTKKDWDNSIPPAEYWDLKLMRNILMPQTSVSITSKVRRGSFRHCT